MWKGNLRCDPKIWVFLPYTLIFDLTLTRPQKARSYVKTRVFSLIAFLRRSVRAVRESAKVGKK